MGVLSLTLGVSGCKKKTVSFPAASDELVTASDDSDIIYVVSDPKVPFVCGRGGFDGARFYVLKTNWD